MPRLVIVLPLSPLHDGDTFAVRDWPLHITVLAPFLTDAEPSAVADALAEVASTQTALIAVAGPNEMFGRRENVPVTVVVDNPALTRLHHDLIEAIRPLGASPDEPAFTGDGFRAHVTVKRNGRVHEGDELSLTQLALVDMAPRSGPGRSVLATFPLRAAE